MANGGLPLEGCVDVAAHAALVPEAVGRTWRGDS
jgi:hypothetical protein